MNYNRDGCQRQIRIKLHKLCPDGEHDIGNSKSRVEIPLTSFGKDTDSLRAVMLFLKKNRGSGNPLTNNEVHNSYNGRKVAKNACFSFPAQIFKNEDDQIGTDKIDNLISEALTYYEDNRYYVFTIIKLYLIYYLIVKTRN